MVSEKRKQLREETKRRARQSGGFIPHRRGNIDYLDKEHVMMKRVFPDQKSIQGAIRMNKDMGIRSKPVKVKKGFVLGIHKGDLMKSKLATAPSASKVAEVLGIPKHGKEDISRYRSRRKRR